MSEAGKARHVLVIDTSYALSVGVAGERPLVDRDSRSHVEKLMPFVSRVVAGTGLTPADLTDIVVATGPGPFTGLRAGIVAARGLAFATGARLIGQDVLSAQAWWVASRDGSGKAGRFPRFVLALNDARRKQLYWQLFRLDAAGHVGDRDTAGDAHPVPIALNPMDIAYPQTIARTVLASLSPSSSLSVVGPGAAKYADAWGWLSDQGIDVAEVRTEPLTQVAGAEGLALFARVAVRNAEEGKDVSSEPLYLRRPDAQLPPPLKPVLEGQSGPSVSRAERSLPASLRAQAPQTREQASTEARDLAWLSWSKEDLKRFATRTDPDVDDDEPDELTSFHRSGHEAEGPDKTGDSGREKDA